MKFNLKYEYLLITGITALTLVLVFFSSFFRVVFGLPYVLFVPGYLLTVIIFPRSDNPGVFFRITLSVGLSIIVVPLLGLLHNYISLPAGLLPLMISLTFFNAVLMLAGWFRRKKIPADERFGLTAEFDFAELTNKFKKNKIIYTAIMISVISIFAVLIFILSAPAESANFTEFYITGSEGTADFSRFRAGEYINVNVVIVCYENKTTEYTLEIKADGELILSMDRITLDRLEKWENTVSLKTEVAEAAVKIEFLLYTGRDMTPYRQLKLWIKMPDRKSGIQ